MATINPCLTFNCNCEEGEQEILKIEGGKRIDFELRFFGPFESSDRAYTTPEGISDNQTKEKMGFWR